MVKRSVIHILLLSLMMMASLFTKVVFAQDLEIKIVEKASGIVAEKGMMVSVHYQGRLEDGTVFDDSHKRGEPISFTLGKGQVIKGWEQGIEGMVVGEKRVLTIPPELGYGANGAGDVIPPNATLIFDVELMAASQPPELGELDNTALKAAQEAGVVIIDIRGEDEWAQTGIIEGAKLITGFAPNGAVDPNFLPAFNEAVPTKETPFILYCRTGNRTNMLGRALVEQLGYSKASHLSEGIVGWSEAGETTKPYQD